MLDAEKMQESNRAGSRGLPGSRKNRVGRIQGRPGAEIGQALVSWSFRFSGLRPRQQDSMSSTPLLSLLYWWGMKKEDENTFGKKCLTQ